MIGKIESQKRNDNWTEHRLIQINYDTDKMNPNIVSLTGPKPMAKNSNLNIFDKKRFDREENQDIQAPNTCVKSGLKPHFIICVYEMKKDIYVSNQILKSGIWEKEISDLIKGMLLHYDQQDIIFLDVGANLGFHSLHAAKLGYKVWAVEPQQPNVIKIFRSALRSGVSDKLTIV